MVDLRESIALTPEHGETVAGRRNPSPCSCIISSSLIYFLEHSHRVNEPAEPRLRWHPFCYEAVWLICYFTPNISFEENMLPQHSFAILITLAVMASSCVSPLAVYRLNSVGSEQTWIWGKEHVVQHSSDVEIGARYSHTQGEFLVFDVDVVNLSERSILVDPVKFYGMPLADTNVTIRVKGAALKFHAENPERILEKIDKRVSQENAYQTNMAIANLTTDVLTIAGDIASIGTKKTEEDLRKKDEARREEDNNRLTQRIGYENTIRQLDAERTEWSTYALRKHTLLPEDTIQGRVYFRTYAKAKFIRIAFVLDGREFMFLYTQERV